MKKLINYIVHAETLAQAEELTKYQYTLFGGCNLPNDCMYYRIHPDNWYKILGTYGRCENKEFYETEYPELPILTFKEWKEMIKGEENPKIYRIKTEEEFIQEFGNSWRMEVGFNCEGYMDYLFGRVLTKEDHRFVGTELSFSITNENSAMKQFSEWRINSKMITDKPLKMEKEIIGYSVVKYWPSIPQDIKDGWASTKSSYGYDFAVGSLRYEEYKHFLNSEFFEPVYKQEKEWIEVTMGNPKHNITIFKNGTYAYHNKQRKVQDIADFLKNINFPWEVKEVKIGCSFFTIKELETAIHRYQAEFSEKN